MVTTWSTGPDYYQIAGDKQSLPGNSTGPNLQGSVTLVSEPHATHTKAWIGLLYTE